MTLPDQNRSRFRNRHSDNRKPAHRCGSNEIGGERGRVLDRGTMAKHPRYLELAWQAKVVGDEVAVQHNLQHAEHWDRTSMAGWQAGGHAAGSDQRKDPCRLIPTSRSFDRSSLDVAACGSNTARLIDENTPVWRRTLAAGNDANSEAMLDLEGSMSGCEITPLNRNHGLDYPTASGLVLADGLMVANAPMMVYQEAGLGWLWVAASFGDKGARKQLEAALREGG